MRDRPLFRVEGEATLPANWHDQLQMALAIADAPFLKSLLTHCQPAIAEPQHIATIAAEVAIPTRSGQTADAVLRYQATKCVLADPPHLPPPVSVGTLRENRDLARLVRHESEMHSLGQHLPLAPTVALLAESGFSSEQIQDILHLPQDCWHKSWWYFMDGTGHFTWPFLRCIRALHYPDGTVTLQYKDYFEEIKPTCFTSQPVQVLIASKPETASFTETLSQINQQRAALHLHHTILIAAQLTVLETQAFMRQGVSVYPMINVLQPLQADCRHCGVSECPMNRQENSPVALCYAFLPETSLV